MDTADVKDDHNKRICVVRVKPVGVGGGGGAPSSSSGKSMIQYTARSISVQNRQTFTYPTMVVPPAMDQAEVFSNFMQRCIDEFFSGYNVNVIAYGQTGTGKTHTMFGPPNCMQEASRGTYGVQVQPNYGLFPRGIFEVYRRIQEKHASDTTNAFVLTCSAVELCGMGNEDMFDKKEKKNYSFALGSGAHGVILDKMSKPPRLYGQNEILIETEEDILRVFGAISSRNTDSTLLNDSSSRSHCFVSLTLWRHEKSSNLLFKTRFQFCDLAGSEKIDLAHNETQMKFTNGEWNIPVIFGISTNFSYSELQRCLNDITIQKKQKRKFNFTAYVTDLVYLLSGSLIGNSLTALFVCISQAKTNIGASNYALNFGKKILKIKYKL